jgi:hypothetical protein
MSDQKSPQADQGKAVQSAYLQQQLSEPKSKVGLFDLPCGFLAPDGELITEVQLREITGVEEDLLAAKNIPGAKKMTQLIANCLVRLGPVVDKPILVNCARALTIGDRAFLMLAIRRVTLGDEFPYEAKCTECEKKFFVSVDLSTLEVKTMPDPKKRVYEVMLPRAQKVARWHVMTGKEEETLAKAKTDDRISAAVLCRLDTLDGQPATFDHVRAMSMLDRDFLREQFDEMEGGIDTTLELECTHCGETFTTDLEVNQSGFFFPSRTRKILKPSTSSS